MLSPLDPYLSERVRSALETEFYARINEQSLMENLVKDAGFVQDPVYHLGLYSDHGVVHVRDVAHQILDVLNAVNGVLIPHRPPERLDFFMRACGVILAYLHDIGMRDMTPFGRAIHPEFASQFVFTSAFTPLFEIIWEENCGKIASRLVNLADDGLLDQPPALVLREILSLSNSHSKSKVPTATLNDPEDLRQTMMHILSTDLRILHLEYDLKKIEKKQRNHPASDTESALDEAKAALRTALAVPDHSATIYRQTSAFYHDFERKAFTWLISQHEKVQSLRDDVIDTLRALRCADALRQRGTVLKTSGSYEIFVDQMTARAICALRLGDDQLYMLETPSILSSGEANLASSELGVDGNLRISFHRGAFATPETTHKAAYNAAFVVNDIQSDVIESFDRLQPLPGITAAHDIKILLEGVDDNLEFANLVAQELEQLNPDLIGRVQPVPSLQSATPTERELYLHAPELTSIDIDQRELLRHLAASGQRIEVLNLERAFHHVKVIHLDQGATLIEVGTPASFVYVPFKEGLKVFPLGGYEAFSVQPWMPLGSTGVIRGALRNATVVCDQAMELLMIPKEVYLRWWHNPYTSAALSQRLSKGRLDEFTSL